MAPHLRTYGKKKDISVASKSFDVVNALFAKNICKRKKKKPPVVIKELPKRDSKVDPLNESRNLQVRLEDTFDMLLKGDNYNAVQYNSNLVTDKVSIEKTTSSVQESTVPSIDIESTHHSPIISVQNEPSTELNATSIDCSLEIEVVNKRKRRKSLNLAYDKNAGVIYKPLLNQSLLVNNKSIISSTPNVHQIRNKLMNESVISPIHLKRVHESLLEESMHEIQKWSIIPPDFSNNSQRHVNINRFRNKKKASDKFKMHTQVRLTPINFKKALVGLDRCCVVNITKMPEKSVNADDFENFASKKIKDIIQNTLESEHSDSEEEIESRRITRSSKRIITTTNDDLDKSLAKFRRAKRKANDSSNNKSKSQKSILRTRSKSSIDVYSLIDDSCMQSKSRVESKVITSNTISDEDEELCLIEINRSKIKRRQTVAGLSYDDCRSRSRNKARSKSRSRNKTRSKSRSRYDRSYRSKTRSPSRSRIITRSQSRCNLDETTPNGSIRRSKTSLGEMTTKTYRTRSKSNVGERLPTTMITRSQSRLNLDESSFQQSKSNKQTSLNSLFDYDCTPNYDSFEKIILNDSSLFNEIIKKKSATKLNKTKNDSNSFVRLRVQSSTEKLVSSNSTIDSSVVTYKSTNNSTDLFSSYNSETRLINVKRKASNNSIAQIDYNNSTDLFDKSSRITINDTTNVPELSNISTNSLVSKDATNELTNSLILKQPTSPKLRSIEPTKRLSKSELSYISRNETTNVVSKSSLISSTPLKTNIKQEIDVDIEVSEYTRTGLFNSRNTTINSSFGSYTDELIDCNLPSVLSLMPHNIIRRDTRTNSVITMRNGFDEELKVYNVNINIEGNSHCESSISKQVFKSDQDDEVVEEISDVHCDGDYVTPQLPRRTVSIFGKKFRRTLLNMRRSSYFDVLSKDDTSSKCNDSRILDISTACRKSIRFVPDPQMSKKSIRHSIIKSYANSTNLGYVPNSVQGSGALENLFEDFSLDVKKSRQQALNEPAFFTAKDIVLLRCGQEEPEPFSECYPNSVLKNCQKIGEGVYGEVFLFRNTKGSTSVMKVIPIEGDLIVNGERQKKFDEILSEVVIAMELSALKNDKKNSTSGFNEVRGIHCVKGKYPERLLELWDLYDETKGSENDCPDVFSDEQMYIVLELANGGKDLESYVFNNALQAYSLFMQTACSLAVAEAALQFEHRDLHWGNILISNTDKSTTLTYNLNGRQLSVPSEGVQVSIIDFTLSRIRYDGICIFNDLGQDPDLFTAEGDYQFEIYRLMQKCNGNNWQHFVPYTNILWLHYTLDKMINALRYKYPLTKTHKNYIKKMIDLKEKILKYKSVEEFVNQM